MGYHTESPSQAHRAPQRPPQSLRDTQVISSLESTPFDVPEEVSLSRAL